MLMKRLVMILPYCIIAAVLAGLIFVNVGKSDTVTSSQTQDTPLIVLDAGHGGQDGGAVAKDGTQEQYINLDITLKLNEILTKDGYRTLLTRTDDNSIHDADAKTTREQKVSDIHNRLKIVEANPGCLFVSIHQNYYTESQYSGAQVFYSPNAPESSQLAQCIQSSIVSSLQPGNNRQIKESGSSIYILYHATEPAVLVECGFLSNPEETAKLNEESYRQQMAQAIADGIETYINSREEESSSCVPS